MNDSKIKEEFEKWRNLPETPEEEQLFDNGENVQAGFYAGFRAAESLSKIEVLEEVINTLPNAESVSDVYRDLKALISKLKAGN